MKTFKVFFSPIPNETYGYELWKSWNYKGKKGFCLEETRDQTLIKKRKKYGNNFALDSTLFAFDIQFFAQQLEVAVSDDFALFMAH